MLRLKGMLGLGDNLYQRAVVRELGPVELETSWPQLYADLPVRCIRPNTKLRTQAKNAERAGVVWASSTSPMHRHFGYDGQGTILASLLRSAGIKRQQVDFTGPATGAKPTRNILVRPATVRSEWRADSRNPDPWYIAQAVDLLKEDFNIISIADLEEGKEWALGPLPFAHETYHKGEIPIEELLKLVDGAAGVVGGVGWAVPACVAYNTPMLLLYGGWGCMNGPQRLFDPRMDTSKIVQAKPDKFCPCNDRAHACSKHISHLGDYVETFYRLAEARSPAMVA